MRIAILLALVLVGFSTSAAAQALEGCGTKWEQLSSGFVRMGEQHYRRTGDVEVTCEDMKFFADELDMYPDKNLLVARGNVVFTSGGNRIGADRMEFDTKTRTGTFYNAAGTASIGDRVDRSQFGSQEPDAYFYGEKIEKLGPRKYRISKGGFTTCVQPTPRWELTSGTTTLTLDEYAFLRNSVLRVKGVPLLYLPVFYYPIQEDDRATGFLIPTYGASSYRGQTISNAFFWAIGRSHDATFFHDWFSKTGQGGGGEYRYVLSPEATGNLKASIVNENESEGVAAGRSYQIYGAAVQRLPGNLRARGQVQYFSDIRTQQLYQQDVYTQSNRQRSYNLNVSGNWGTHSLMGTFDNREVFYGQFGTDVSLFRYAPRLTYTRAERPIGNSPVYFAVNGEYAAIEKRDQTASINLDRSLQRFDVTPLARIPFTRWPFLTINSSIAWRQTYWTKSQEPGTGNQPIVDEGISRGYADLQATVTGPVFNRIFNTPGSGYADKFKHVIEPSVTFQRTSAIDNADEIVKLDGADYVVGNVTRIAYSLTNRLYAKRRRGGAPGVSREILTFSITQSYYTDENAARVDQEYQSNYGTAPPSHFSPVAAVVRASPADHLNGEFRAEYDVDFGALRALNASGTWREDRIQVTGGWSFRQYIPTVPTQDPLRRDQYLTTATTLRTESNRIGGTYSFYWDIQNNRLLEQRIVGYYNAQCCGFGVEYQTYNLGLFGTTFGVPKDRRFNISVTLAGIGTFSNLLGAFGGQPTR